MDQDIDETKQISAKTRSRVGESIIKDGYMNGAADGQSNIYQESFDKGYKEGLKFGYEIGFHDALENSKSSTGNVIEVNKEHLNCQICNNNISIQQDVRNIIKQQKDSNESYLIFLCTK